MKELVLTNSKLFFPNDDDKEYVFLGDWCLNTTEEYKKFFKQTLKSPYKNMDGVLQAAEYIQKISLRIISENYSILNEVIGINLSRKFWDIYLGPSLINFLGIFYDRYLNIVKILGMNEEFNVRIVNIEGGFKTKSRDIFYQNFLGSEGNLILYSYILKNLSFDRLKTQPLFLEKENIYFRNAGITYEDNYIIEIDETLKSSILYRMFFSKKLYLGSIYGMTHIDKILLLNKTFGFTNYSINLIKNIIQLSRKSKEFFFLDQNILRFPADNQFESLIEKILPSVLPIPTKKTIESIDQYVPKIWIGTDIFNNNEIEIGLTKEKNGRWINIQHGGGYGALKSLPQTFYEYKLSDKFLTWGWKYQHIQKDICFITEPKSPLLSKVKNEGNKNSSQNILLISTDHHKSFYKIQSTLLSDQHVNYEETKLEFYENLNNDTKKHFVYRPYPIRYSDKLEPILKINVSLDVKKYKQQTDIYKKYKLIVVDHIATSHLISIAMNIPTLIYFDKTIFGISDEAEIFYKNLENVGVVFRSAKLAAEKINSIYSSIDEWWNEPERQRALNEFRIAHCDTEPNWKESWLKFIQKEVLTI